MRKKFVAIIFFTLVFFTGVSSAQDFEVKVSVDSMQGVYLVGDHINLKFEILANKGIDFTFPNVVDSIKSLEFVANKDTVRGELNGKQRIVYKITFAGFDSGKVVIPSITFPYQKAKSADYSYFKSDSLTLQIKTVAVDTTKEIKDIREPEKMSFNWWWVVLWVVLGITLAVVAYFIYKRIKERKSIIPQKPVIRKTPYEIAVEELAKVEKKELWQNNLVKEYYTELTDVVRIYFDGRFNFSALESTTDEVLAFIKKNNDVSVVYDDTATLLQLADLVKFAKYFPNENDHINALNRAYDILNKTKHLNAPAAPKGDLEMNEQPVEPASEDPSHDEQSKGGTE